MVLSRWEHLRREDVERALKLKAAVLLPVGTLEEHGPHLPMGTDLIQAEHVLKGVAERTGSILLPPIYYGQSHSTSGYPGSVLISTEALFALVRDILLSVISKGFKRILISSGHAGSIHLATIRDAAHLVASEHRDVRIWVVSEYEIARSLAAKRGDFCKDDGHGGDVETSRMLDIAPEMVGKVLPGPSHERAPQDLVMVDGRGFLDRGYVGDPSMATPEKGRYLNDELIEALCRMLEG